MLLLEIVELLSPGERNVCFGVDFVRVVGSVIPTFCNRQIIYKYNTFLTPFTEGH